MALEGETVNVTGNVRFGNPYQWSATQAVNGSVTATSAAFGMTFDSTRLKQLQCDSWSYAANYKRIMPLGDSITEQPGWRAAMQTNQMQPRSDLVPYDFVGNTPVSQNNFSWDDDKNGYTGYACADLLKPAGTGTGPGPVNLSNPPPYYYRDARDMDDWFAGQTPDIVIMHFGTNDLAGPGTTTAQVLNAYSLLLAKARLQNPGVVYVVAQIIPIGPSFSGALARVQDLNAAIPGWASANTTSQSPIIVVDQYTGFDVSTMTDDGVHPNATGAAQMGARFFTAIQPYITKNTSRKGIYNAGYIQPWAADQHFANLIHPTYPGDWNGGGATLDALGDIATLSIGGTVRRNLSDFYGANLTKFGTIAGQQLSYIKGGNYIVKWSGTDVPVSVNWPPGASGLTKLGTRRWQVTLAQVPETSGGNKLSLDFTNNTGSTTCPINNLVVCHADHETWVDGGGITNPDYISAVGGMYAFRPMTAYMVNESLMTQASQMRLPSSPGYGMYTDGGDFNQWGLPYEVAIKMAMELNAQAIWINCPYRMTSQTEMNALAARCWATAGVQASSIKFILEYSNENWGSFPAHTQFCRDYGIAQGFPEGAPAGEAILCMMWARAFLNAGVPRNRLLVTVGVQTGVFGGQSWIDYLLNHTDSTNILGTGGNKKLWQLIDMVVASAYIAPALDSSYGGGSYLFHGRLMNRAPGATDAQLDTWWDNAISTIGQQYDAQGAFIRGLGFAGTYSMYEGGNQTNITDPGIGGVAQLCTISASDNTVVWDTTNQGELPVYADGDAWIFVGGGSDPSAQGYGNGPATTVTPRGGQLVYIRAVSSTKARFYLTLSGATTVYANDAAAKAASIVLNDNNANAPYWVFNYSRVVASQVRINSYLDSPAGGAMYQRLVNAITAAGRSAHFAFFQDSGQYTLEYGASYGLIRSIYAPATARWNFARAF